MLFKVDQFVGSTTPKTFDIWNVPRTATELSGALSDDGGYDDNEAPGPAIYAELGSGTLYGTGTVVSSDNNSGVFLEFALNSAAIAAINNSVAGTGDSSLGLAMQSPTFPDDRFRIDKTQPIQLQLTVVPEASEAALVLLGVTGLTAWRRRKHRA